MKENSSISEYRHRLDKTLSLYDLTHVERIRALVKDQIVSSSHIENEEDVDNIVENRTAQASHFLGMLRSTSINDIEMSKQGETSHDGWKVKQDSEEFRVMYREGPEGSPFHTLLVEGYVEGPVDVCLCISCEAELYPKWWPQTAIPTFKITSSRCLKKVGIGEQICLIRMKVSWPLSPREAVVHYYVFEYFQDDLVLVLLNSIPDLDGISANTHGFTRDGIPDFEDVIRIDVVGGFAIQKVSANRSYFRTIANMDIKLDFIPPSFINFISRQLVGSGFRLYKKKVASVTKGDEDFSKALTDPLYARVREAIFSKSLSASAPEYEGLNNKSSLLVEEQTAEQNEVRTAEDMINYDHLAPDLDAKDSSVQEKKSQQEIKEIKKEENESGMKKMPNSEIVEIEEANEEESKGMPGVDNVSCSYETAVRSSPEVFTKDTCSSEIEEENHENNQSPSLDAKRSFDAPEYGAVSTILPKTEKQVVVRPEVEKALRTLEQAITIIRQQGSDHKTTASPAFPKEKGSQNPDKDTVKESVSSDQISIKDGIAPSPTLIKDDPEISAAYKARNSSSSIGSRRQGSNSYVRDTNHNKVAPASPNEDVAAPPETHQNETHSPHNLETLMHVQDETTQEYNNMTMDAPNDLDEKKMRRRKRNPRYWCVRVFACV